VQIRTQNPPPVDTEVVLLLSLDDRKAKQLRIPGRVAWVRQDETFSGMGVRFDAESTEEKKRLRDLLRKSMERGKIGIEEDE
jgi:Tfp pilus assembly protein PilZ